MCLTDEALNYSLGPAGGAAYSVENALAAAVTVDGHQRGWGLWGSLYSSAASHAKFGIASPPSTPPTKFLPNSGQLYFVSGDMNQQDWPPAPRHAPARSLDVVAASSRLPLHLSMLRLTSWCSSCALAMCAASPRTASATTAAQARTRRSGCRSYRSRRSLRRPSGKPKRGALHSTARLTCKQSTTTRQRSTPQTTRPSRSL